MGINKDMAAWLVTSYRRNADFSRVLTLGRQNWFLSPRESRGIIASIGKPYQGELLDRYSRFKFSDQFWHLLGDPAPQSLDMTDRDGSTVRHDLNIPVPEEWHGRYTAIIDGGTLEHVFNLPIAMENCMRMLGVGGTLFIATPANNFFGHGFYQLQPEFFFRLLCAANGFRMQEVILQELSPAMRCYYVRDPNEIAQRAAMVNAYPVAMYIAARKIERTPDIIAAPQQSDYVAQWSGTPAPEQQGYVDALSNPRLDGMKRWLLEMFPRLSRALESIRFSRFNPKYSLHNPRNFQRCRLWKTR